MKARCRRPSAFIVFECLEILMKHEARVYEMAPQKGTQKQKDHVNIQCLFSFVSLSHVHSC